MGKFHINGKGKVEACKATTKVCPLGGLHIEANSPEEAYEKMQETFKKENSILANNKPKTSRDLRSSLSDKELDKITKKMYDYCKKNGYGLSSFDLFDLAKQHENGMKNGNAHDVVFVEELLENLNFHSENEKLYDGNYDELYQNIYDDFTASKFNPEHFEKRLPHDMRFKEVNFDLNLNGKGNHELYWVSQAGHTQEDRDKFKEEVLKDAKIHFINPETKSIKVREHARDHRYEGTEKYRNIYTITKDDNGELQVDYENVGECQIFAKSPKIKTEADMTSAITPKQNTVQDIIKNMPTYTVSRLNMIVPEAKDIDRARSCQSFSRAQQQANSIKDTKKLIRRYKAFHSQNYMMSKAFHPALNNHGFTDDHIALII